MTARLTILCVTLALVTHAIPVSAKSVIRSGETVSVAADQIVEGDFYTAASIVNISGAVTEDVLAAGGKVTLNGVAQQDLLIVAGSADIHGVVNEDVRILAGETVLAEPIAGDVFVVGGTLEILSTATIGGDVLFFGGEAKINGAVEGDILGYAAMLRIDSAVAGDVNVTTEQLVLGDRATIAGSVQYTSEQLVTRSQNTTIAGDLLRNDPVIPAAGPAIRGVLLPALILLFTALAWFLLARLSFARVTERALRSLPRSALLGTVVLLGLPFLAFILLASVIGLQVGFILLLLYVVIVLLGAAMMLPIAGQLLQTMFMKSNQSFNLLTLLLGAMLVVVLSLLPILGVILLFALLLIGVGATADVLFHAVRR